MLRIGITGGTGAGKTTLLKLLERRGAVIVDCDEAYHTLLKTDKALTGELKSRFPAAFKDGTLDRKALGTIVFSDENELLALNAITARYVDIETDRRIADAEKRGVTLAAVDAIGLFESGMAKKCDATVAVLADTELRAKRLMAREGISRQYALLRINAQKPDEFYETRCDYVLRNDGDIEDFQAACTAALDSIVGKEKA